MSGPTRPFFTPSQCTDDDRTSPLEDEDGAMEWVPVCECPAGFPIELFEEAILQLVHHPEYNSTLILRSEVLEKTEAETTALRIPHLRAHRFARNIRRRLLPRRPGRDPPIQQDCTFYIADTIGDHEDASLVSCLVLTPVLRTDEQMPYYHPAVHHLAFRYITALKEGNSETSLRIDLVPLPSAPDPRDINSRLYRTCLALLETAHRYGWGTMTNYQKRVHHDCIVSREDYQDLYLIMRERHKHIVDEWKESTDPLKHVFEDIGIATFLMLLWKQDISATRGKPFVSIETADTTTPWHNWPRPPGGFLDLGCGNGLLVHILISEGYAGEGIDVRARTSWAHYPPSTQAHLHVHALNPIDVRGDDPFLRPGAFMIANHADELSPWTPVLATTCSASGYMSIPCCAWSFDARFDRAQVTQQGSNSTPFAFAFPPNTSEAEFIDSLKLGGLGGASSSYSMYRAWLANLSLHCGWQLESDTLRIPSTRNWAIVGRQNDSDEVNVDERHGLQNALSIVSEVRERGVFKTRRPEGKAGDH